MKQVLLAGGAGYIGSTITKFLLEQGYTPIIIDNFYNSTERNVKTLEKTFDTQIKLINFDLKQSLENLDLPQVDAVIHLAAYKAVGESVKDPLKYYENNLGTTINLLNWCKANNVKKFIFSSTAAIYGNTKKMPITEESDIDPISPYAQSKLMAENIIGDCAKSYGINSVIFRYFNVAGADRDGKIGDECKHPDNLVPIMMNVLLGKTPGPMKVFGGDYPTRDGSAIRDYIHVDDLADAHIKAINYLTDKEGSFLFNLGTGNGTSVLEMIKTMEEVFEQKLAYEIVDRREGDAAESFTNPALALKELGWAPTKTLKEVFESVKKWYV